MALTDESGSGMVMPVSPMYGNGNGMGFGGDWAWIILLLLLGWGNGGWGGGFDGGAGGLYPWMNQAEITSGGFRDQMINGNITSVRDGIFDISTQLCNGFAGVNASIANGFAQSEIAANARQMADMQQNFALQSQFADCCCENRLGIANLANVVQSENCADRYEAAQNTRDIIENANRNSQAVLDKLCALEIESKNDTIAQLRSELIFARGQASQDVQTAAIQAGQRTLANEIEQYLAPTPKPAYVVANPNCCNAVAGCGCGSF